MVKRVDRGTRTGRKEVFDTSPGRGIRLFSSLSVINETPLFPSDADFNQISLVWAKCRYWQAVPAV
jgi:hypothetical protein